MAYLLLTCFLALLSSKLGESSGVFELKVHSFRSTHNVCRRSRDCQIFFRVCLKHSQAVISPEPPCTYGTGLTEIFRADQSAIASSAPIKVPFHFKWPGTFSLIIEAWNADSTEQSTDNHNNLISRLATRRRLAIGEDWSQDVNFGEQTAPTTADLVTIPSDTIPATELETESVSLAGKDSIVQNPSARLAVATSTVTVSPQASASAALGGKARCATSVCATPGCLHGTCGQPWQCNCKEGWGGLFCNQDLNYCTNHKPCRNGATCTNTGQGSYTCACRQGFSGSNCEIETNECDSNPCKNGGSCNDMENDYSCTCPQGFYGKNCEISAMTCADGALLQWRHLR
ncbi:hypothetical protein SKAU_G00091760 [Synaphobranchus kaupii]|uniref:EGF-like domain-containing protein n=1 Tax=Synaphobranchus kaupii TaxID=118154 RepID=A0A9Q1FXN4_SYNKA|nr:hypothetical protein SKAU_G00091760 [Synaphobranchus kaupii]